MSLIRPLRSLPRLLLHPHLNLSASQAVTCTPILARPAVRSSLSTSSALHRETYKIGSKSASRHKFYQEAQGQEGGSDLAADIDLLSEAESKRPTLIQDVEDEFQDASEEPSEATKAADTFQTFPDMDTLEQVFDGQKYKDLPFVHIRCHKNNTRFIAYAADFRQIEYCVPADFGFVNAAKRTDVAAQVAGVNMGRRLHNRNIRTIRVTVEGFNAAKLAAIKGLTQAGMKVVSITDHTTVDWGWKRRPKKRPRPYNYLQSFLTNKYRYY